MIHTRISPMRSPIRRVARRALLAVAIPLSAVLPPVATQAEAEPSDFQIAASSAEPGTAVDVVGSCVMVGPPAEVAVVSLTYVTDPRVAYSISSSIPVAASGAVGGSFTVPLKAPGGRYRISIRCYEGDAVGGGGVFDFEVTGAAPPPGRNRVRLRLVNTSAEPGGGFRLQGSCRLFGTEPAGLEVAMAPIDSHGPPYGPQPAVRQAFPPPRSGTLDVALGVPPDSPPGRYALSTFCELDGVAFGGREYTVLVLAPDAPPKVQTPHPPALPRTGG